MHKIAPWNVAAVGVATLLAGLFVGLGAMANPAAASTATIGQTGAGFGCGGPSSSVQTSTGTGVPSYVVPSGMTEITSWSAQGGSTNSVFALEVWRPTATPGSYVLVGVSPPEETLANTLNTFTLATPISVQPGDVLGQLSAAFSVDCFVTESGPVGDVVELAAADETVLPTPGTTVAFSGPYSGFELNIAATGNSVTVPTTVAVTSSDNPTGFGTPVDFTATVSPGTPVPTGSVQFSVDGRNLGGPVPLTGGKAISPSISTLFPGAHTVTASYSGAGTLPAGTGTLQQTVTGCPSHQVGHDLTAAIRTGTIDGLFCVDTRTGIGTYTQAFLGGEAPVSGLGIVERFLGATKIAAFGRNLFLLGSNVGSQSLFGELAPTEALGTFTLG